jgi:hypothetical protein
MAILLLVPHHRRYTRRSEMKAIIAAVISIAFLIGAPVFLMVKQQSAFAISPYLSRFQHGVSDGKDSCTHYSQKKLV